MIKACAVLALCLLVLPASAQEKNLLRSSIVGSSSCTKKPCYGQVMKSPAVQKLLLNLAAGPQEVQTAEAALQGSGVAAADLLALRLIRRDGNRYVLAFALFTTEDVRRIREVSERYAASLAQAVLEQRKEIDSALRSYDAPGVDPAAAAYFVLGCVSLDWDGLVLTADKGYRKTTAERPDGKYVPDAEQLSDFSLQRIFWGSHSYSIGAAHFTSFGDHHSPRYTLPDLLWQMPSRVSKMGYPEEVQPALRSLLDESLEPIVGRMGAIMLTLRDGEKSSAEIAQTINVKPEQAETLLHVLEGLDYVAEHNNRFQARIPVFTKQRDAATIAHLRATGNQAMEAWLAANYSRMEAELKDLSYTRSGVPFEEGFTMIWHYVFGMTNQKLVEAGLFADPYAPSRKFKGSIPAVFDLDLQAP